MVENPREFTNSSKSRLLNRISCPKQILPYQFGSQSKILLSGRSKISPLWDSSLYAKNSPLHAPSSQKPAGWGFPFHICIAHSFQSFRMMRRWRIYIKKPTSYWRQTSGCMSLRGRDLIIGEMLHCNSGRFFYMFFNLYYSTHNSPKCQDLNCNNCWCYIVLRVISSICSWISTNLLTIARKVKIWIVTTGPSLIIG